MPRPRASGGGPREGSQGPCAGEKSPGGLCGVGPAVAAQERSVTANESLLYNHAGRDVQGPVGGCSRMGGGDFFLRDKVGGMGEASWLWALFLLTRLYPVGVRNSN